MSVFVSSGNKSWFTKHTHTRTHTPTHPLSHTHTHLREHTQTQTHTHTHTHTHLPCLSSLGFAQYCAGGSCFPDPLRAHREPRVATPFSILKRKNNIEAAFPLASILTPSMQRWRRKPRRPTRALIVQSTQRRAGEAQQKLGRFECLNCNPTAPKHNFKFATGASFWRPPSQRTGASDGTAGMVLQGWRCRDGAARMVPAETVTCRDCALGTALQGQHCGGGTAGTHGAARTALDGNLALILGAGSRARLASKRKQ